MFETPEHLEEDALFDVEYSDVCIGFAFCINQEVITVQDSNLQAYFTLEPNFDKELQLFYMLNNSREY